MESRRGSLAGYREEPPAAIPYKEMKAKKLNLTTVR
jgi:hypothetical protein